MRIFYKEGGIPQEINIEDNSVGIIFSPEECKSLWKPLKYRAKKKQNFFLTISNINEDRNDVLSIINFLKRKEHEGKHRTFIEKISPDEV